MELEIKRLREILTKIVDLGETSHGHMKWGELWDLQELMQETAEEGLKEPCVK